MQHIMTLRPFMSAANFVPFMNTFVCIIIPLGMINGVLLIVRNPDCIAPGCCLRILPL